MTYTAMVDRTEAGPLIPEDAANEIIKEATEKSYVLSAFKRRSMSRKQQRIPIFDRKPVAYFVNGDTGLKQTSDVRWDNIYLNAEELAVIVPVPDILVEDAAFDIWGQLRPEITEAIGAKIDEAVLFGVDRPTSWPVGILPGATAASQVVTGGTGDDVFADINTAMVMLEEDGYDPMSMVGRVQMRGILRNVRDANRGFLYPAAGPSNAGGQSVGWKGEVWNTPLFISKMGYTGFAAGANNAALFVLDTDNLVVAVRDDINMKVFTEGVISNDSGQVILNLMQQDAKALRVTFRVAWAMANPVTRQQPNRSLRYPAAVLTQGTITALQAPGAQNGTTEQGLLGGTQQPALGETQPVPGSGITDPVTGETVPVQNP